MAESNSIAGTTIINHEAGDTLKRTFTIKEGGVVVNFTGATVEFIISEDQDGASVITANHFTGSGTTTDLVNGVIEIRTATTLLTPRTVYWYKLKVTFASGIIKTYLEDKLKTK